MILRLERSLPCNKFEDRDTKCPEIDILIIATSNVDFRSQVEVSSDDGQHISSLPSEISFLGDSEIDELDGFCVFVI